MIIVIIRSNITYLKETFINVVTLRRPMRTYDKKTAMLSHNNNVI